MARGDLFDFGDPTDPLRRDLEGKFIDGPKVVGLVEVAQPVKPRGVEAIGHPVDGPRSGKLQGVETWGKPIGHSLHPDKRGVGDAIGVIVIVVLFVLAALLIYG